VKRALGSLGGCYEGQIPGGTWRLIQPTHEHWEGMGTVVDARQGAISSRITAVPQPRSAYCLPYLYAVRPFGPSY